MSRRHLSSIGTEPQGLTTWMTTGGLSLWLSPPPSSGLDALVARLAKKHSTVPFSSHATLVSDAIVPSKPVDELVQSIKAAVETWQERERTQGEGPELTFQDVRQGDSFYQCVLAALVPTSSLVHLHEALLRAFSLPVPSPPTYFPHLSLLYADVSRDFKAKVIEELIESGEAVPSETDSEEKRVALDGEKSFKPTEILLARTAGPPPEWEVLARIPFDRPSQ